MPATVPFPSSVPILGQPITVLGYTVVVSAKCQCEAGTQLQLLTQLSGSGVQGVASGCPACHRVYAVQGMAMTPHGHLTFAIGIQEPGARIDS